LGPAGKLRLMKKHNSNVDIMLASKGRLRNLGLAQTESEERIRDKSTEVKILRGQARPQENRRKESFMGRFHKNIDNILIDT
jgi:hypothetical protein